MRNLKHIGFTLIELLVVMTIISVLLGLSTLALQSSRQGARDTKRKADLEQVRSGLETYRSDVGAYPASLTIASGLTCGSNNYLGVGTFIDPISPTYGYVYIAGGISVAGCGGVSGAGNTTYTLCARLEMVPSTLPTGACSGQLCGTGGNCNYEVTSP